MNRILQFTSTVFLSLICSLHAQAELIKLDYSFTTDVTELLPLANTVSGSILYDTELAPISTRGDEPNITTRIYSILSQEITINGITYVDPRTSPLTPIIIVENDGPSGNDGSGVLFLSSSLSALGTIGMTRLQLSLIQSDTKVPEAKLENIPLSLGGYDSTAVFFDFTGGNCDTSECSASSTLDTLTFTSVPIPAATWLFSSALVGLVGIKRKK